MRDSGYREALSRHSAPGVMSEILAYNIGQYRDDSITLLGALRKSELQQDTQQPLQSLSLSGLQLSDELGPNRNRRFN